MNWSVAQAKQQFSEMLRAAAREPQAIYNRTTPVAMVLGTEDFEAFQQWKQRNSVSPCIESIARLRTELSVAGFDGIEIEPRPIESRTSDFALMLDEEYAPPRRASRKKAHRRGTR